MRRQKRAVDSSGSGRSDSVVVVHRCRPWRLGILNLPMPGKCSLKRDTSFRLSNARDFVANEMTPDGVRERERHDGGGGGGESERERQRQTETDRDRE